MTWNREVLEENKGKEPRGLGWEELIMGKYQQALETKEIGETGFCKDKGLHQKENQFENKEITFTVGESICNLIMV